ncbi:MAG: PaaI family thioesterase [Immundisolibacterales bacterium]|nr:PaaI family thioesterase [Immundisolibacterales bacterium]
MTEPLTVSDVQAMLDGSPFIRGCGMKVVGLDAQALEIAVSMTMRPEFERRAGTGQWHGGPIAALIDTAGDYALALHAGGPVPTINFRTDYLRPAVDTSLTATARVRRAGRTVGLVDIDVTDDAGRLVAVGRGTYGTTAG